MTKRINFTINLVYFIAAAIFVVVRILSNFHVFDFLGNSTSYIIGFITQVGILFLLPFLIFKLMTKASCSDIFKFAGFRRVSYKTIIASVVLGLVIFFVNVYVANFFMSIIEFFGYRQLPSSPSGKQEWWMLILNLISTAVLPAICEEALHRGLLLKGNSEKGIRRSILISAFLFGLLHLNVEQFFYATVIGLFLGYLCWSCNSIIPCIIVHFMNNAISVFLSFARSNGWAIGSIFSAVGNFMMHNHFLGLVLLILFLVLLVIVGWELVKFLVKDSFNYNFGKRQKELTNMAIRENYFKQIEDIKNNSNKTKAIYSTDKNTIYIDFKDFVEYVSKNMETSKKEEEVGHKEISHVELKTKILLYGSFVLGIIITVMTFIWGILR